MTSPPSDYQPAATETAIVSIALYKALRAAGIVLPQMAVDSRGDYAVRLGDCNVTVAARLHELVRDGITLRAKHPEESLHGCR